MCRKSLVALPLALFAALSLSIGQAQAQSNNNQTYTQDAQTFMQDAFSEAYSEIQQDTDDTYGLYAYYFSYVSQYYFSLALQHTSDDMGRSYLYAGYQYGYLAVIFSFSSYITIGVPRGHLGSLYVYIYAAVSIYFAYYAYVNWSSSSHSGNT